MKGVFCLAGGTGEDDRDVDWSSGDLTFPFESTKHSWWRHYYAPVRAMGDKARRACVVKVASRRLVGILFRGGNGRMVVILGYSNRF